MAWEQPKREGDRQKAKPALTAVADGLFRFNFVFNNNKGQSSPQPMAGDIAAVIVYSDELSGNEKQQVREYLNGIYKVAPFRADRAKPPLSTVE